MKTATAGERDEPIARGAAPRSPSATYHAHHARKRRTQPRQSRSRPGGDRALRTPDLPELYFAHDAARSSRRPATGTDNFEYDVERERGLDYQEDLFNPFVLRFDLRARNAARRRSSPRRETAPRRSRRSRCASGNRAAGAQLLAARHARRSLRCSSGRGRRPVHRRARRAARPSSPAITGSAIGAATP